MRSKIFHSVVLVALFLGLGLLSPARAADPVPPPAAPAETSIESSEFKFDLNAITNPSIKRQNWMQQGVNYFLGRAVGIMASLVGSVAVLMMVWGGFLMITSAGEDQYKQGVDTLKKAAIGVVFVLGAYVLVTTVQLLIKSLYSG